MKYSCINTEITEAASQNSNNGKLKTKTDCAVLGYIYVAVSGACWTLMATTIKWFDSLSPYTWTFYPCFVNFVLNCIFLSWRGVHIMEWFGTKRKQVALLSLRLVFGLAGMIGGWMAIQLLELGDAACFRQSVPIWVSLLGWVVLGEKLDLVEICIISFIMGGLLLVARPSVLFGGDVYDRRFFRGMTAGIIGAICTSMAYIAIRKVKLLYPRTENFVIINWLMIGGIFLSYPLSLLSGMPFQLPRGWQVFGVCLGGGLSFLAQLLVTTAIGMERVGPVISVRSSDIILMYVSQALIWGFDTDGLVLRIIGAFLILVGSFSLGVHKWRKTKDKDDYNNLETEHPTQGSCNVEKSSEEQIIFYLKNESKLAPTDSEMMLTLNSKI